jgi:hypothetical protein
VAVGWRAAGANLQSKRKGKRAMERQKGEGWASGQLGETWFRIFVGIHTNFGKDEQVVVEADTK